jgi:hypothetical protein
MKYPPKYLTYDQLTNLNDDRLVNVKKSIIRKKACLYKIYSCECCHVINSEWEHDEYNKKVTPLNSYLELIYDVIKLRRRLNK